MGLYAVGIIGILLLRFALRPWLARRLGGDVPRAPLPVALGIIVVAAIAAGYVGHASKSDVLGLACFIVLLAALATVVGLRTGQRRRR